MGQIAADESEWVESTAGAEGTGELPVTDGFKSPNYTMVPNDYFAALPVMGECEVKIVLMAIRYTIGFHRRQALLSERFLTRKTGIKSRSAVRRGLEKAVEHNFLKRVFPGDQTNPAVYELVIQHTEDPDIAEEQRNWIGGKKPRRAGQPAQRRSSRTGFTREQILPMMQALAEASQVDLGLVGGRVAAMATRLLKQGYTPEQILKHYTGDGCWWSRYWCSEGGKKPPELGVILSTVRRAVAASNGDGKQHVVIQD